MKIAIDISQIIYGTGVSTYTKRLVEGLLKIDKKNNYLLFGSSLRRSGEIKHFLKNKSVESKVFNFPSFAMDILGNKFHYPKIESLIGKIDIYHSSDWTQFASNAAKVTTIHDLAPLLYPEYTSKKVVEVHTRRLGWVKHEVDKIIVPTKSIKEDLIRLGYHDKKIFVVYEGVESSFKVSDTEDVKRVKKRYGINGKFYLAIGVGLRKNTKRIVEAFKKVKGDGEVLVIVGHKYEKTSHEESIIFTGHVPDLDLPPLYTGAEVLLYPSLYEGFGLPILEAFACCCPVVTSAVGSMKEVSGDAACLVDPMDVSSISHGIKKVIKNRSQMTKRGKLRLKDFSWQKAAEQTLSIYEETSG